MKQKTQTGNPLQLLESRMNPHLLRQLRKAFKIPRGKELEELGSFLEEMDNACENSVLSPKAKKFVCGLPAFLKQVSEAYAQSERDLSIKQRSLELSNRELLNSVRRLREESIRQKTILDSLQKSAKKLMEELPGDAYDVDNTDLQSLSTLMAQLVTEKKEAMKQLSEAKKLAESASIAKDKFLANMSHEIRTPLNAILGFTEILMQNATDEEQAHYLKLIHSSGDTLLKLLGDILDLNKIQQGKISVENASFNFREVMKSGLLPYDYQAKEKGLIFNLTIDEKIPKHLIGDSHRLKQVLVNLIGNAIKFTQKGQIDVMFSLQPHRDLPKDQALIKVYVGDTGIGIPPEKQSMIFDSFTQADSSTNRIFGGSGLGLTIVKELVQLMHGNVGIVSPNPMAIGGDSAGSLFWFTLKMGIDSKKENTDKMRKLSKSVLRSLKFPGVRTLVAEDNPVNQLLIRKILEDMGCEVQTVGNGKEAISALEREGFDIVFMDIQMPVMNGHDATRIIRRKGMKNLPIMACTAHVYQEDIQKALNSGMDDHLGKPFRMEEIIKLLKKWAPSE